VLSGQQKKHARKGRPDRAPTTTIIECISADGRVIPPFIIFACRGRLLEDYFPLTIPGDWAFDDSQAREYYRILKQGYLNSINDLQQLRQTFEMEVEPRKNTTKKSKRAILTTRVGRVYATNVHTSIAARYEKDKAAKECKKAKETLLAEANMLSSPPPHGAQSGFFFRFLLLR
jgi:hypothetical protein